MAVDSSFSSVSLLLHLDGSNGQTTFTDSSSYGHTVSRVGSSEISTTQSLFGGASMSVGVDSGVSVPQGAWFNHGTGDYTIEVSLYVAANPPSWSEVLCQYTGGNTIGVNLKLKDTGKLIFYAGNNIPVNISSASSVTLNVWNRIAITCSSGTTRLFLNGVVEATTTSVADISSGMALRVGTSNTGGALVGYIDEVRITKGVARYTANYTPATEEFGGPIPIGSAIASITAPAATLSSYGGGSAYLIAPSPTIGSFTEIVATAALIAPSPTLRTTAHDSYGERAAFLTAPSPTLTIATGAHSRLTAPSPTLTASGTVTIMATATLSAPKPTLSATGTVSGMATATLSAPRPNLIGYGGAVCSVKVRGRASLAATGTTGGVASVAVTCPLFELTATASTGNVATANLVAPSPELGRTIQAWLTAPSARLTAIGSAVVTATYEAYAVNLGHRPRVTNQEIPIDEVTHYTNFPFTHVVRYKNSYYGANSTGLYLLEGTTDNGTAIPWEVKTAMNDFKTPLKKTVAAAYFGGRFGPASTVQLHAGEQTPNTYSFTTPRDALVQNHRQVFGKGVKERYFALGASGIGVCEIDSVELETHNMTRRI